MSSASDFAKIRKRAESQGFRVTTKSRGHFQFLAPDQCSIITCAPHSFDAPNHGLKNFLSKLRRAGYQDEDTMETSAMPPSAPVKINGKSHLRPAARDLVIEYFRAHPGIDVHTQTLKEHIAVKRPDLGKNVIHTIVHGLKAKGLILQTRPRWYRVTSNIVLPETALTHREDSPATAPSPATLPAPSALALPPLSSATTAAPSVAASVSTPHIELAARTGDSFIDGYLEELEAAFSDSLKAFDRIEAIAKRTHATLVHFARLKQSLGLLGQEACGTSDSSLPSAETVLSRNNDAGNHQ